MYGNFRVLSILQTGSPTYCCRFTGCPAWPSTFRLQITKYKGCFRMYMYSEYLVACSLDTLFYIYTQNYQRTSRVRHEDTCTVMQLCSGLTIEQSPEPEESYCSCSILHLHCGSNCVSRVTQRTKKWSTYMYMYMYMYIYMYIYMYVHVCTCTIHKAEQKTV